MSAKTGIKPSKEYQDRWLKPLVNPPISGAEIVKSSMKGKL